MALCVAMCWEMVAMAGSYAGGENNSLRPLTLPGKLDEPCRLPIGEKCFTETEWYAHLAGNRHDDEISPIRVVSLTRNDDGRTFFRTQLIRERKWHQDDIAK